MATENQLIVAHVHGRNYARQLAASLSAARVKAQYDYDTDEERFAFIAGYRGEIARMCGLPNGTYVLK